MNKRKKNQKRKSVNIENNSSSYFPILTAITTNYIFINSSFGVENQEIPNRNMLIKS